MIGVLPDCWKVSSVVPVFKNVGERSTAKNYCPVSLLCVVSKVFQNFANNRIVDNLEKSGLFSDFQYGFRSSRLTADPLTVVSDRIATAFNSPGATRDVKLVTYKTFDRVWHTGFSHKLRSYRISDQTFGLISYFLSNKLLRVVLKKKEKNFMVLFCGWNSTASWLEPVQGGTLAFTTKFPQISGTDFINLRRMKG